MGNKRQLDYEAISHALLLIYEGRDTRGLTEQEAFRSVGIEDSNAHERRLLRRAVYRMLNGRP